MRVTPKSHNRLFSEWTRGRSTCQNPRPHKQLWPGYLQWSACLHGICMSGILQSISARSLLPLSPNQSLQTMSARRTTRAKLVAKSVFTSAVAYANENGGVVMQSSIHLQPQNAVRFRRDRGQTLLALDYFVNYLSSTVIIVGDTNSYSCGDGF
jgi:hypothetical protein